MPPMKLFVVRVNAGSDGSGFAEIERCGFDRFQLTGRNETGVHWGEAGRVQGELMVQDVALSREIEVRMIREIDHGVFVGGGRIFNPQVALHQRVPNYCRQVPRISGLAAFTEIAEFYSICDRLCLPDHVVEAPRPAMKRVCAIVQGQGILYVIQGKAAVGNAIRIAANDGSEERVRGPVEIGHIPVEIIPSEHNIRRFTVTIRRFEGNYNSAVSHDSSFAYRVTQRIDFDRSSVGRFPKWLVCHLSLGLCSHGQHR